MPRVDAHAASMLTLLATTLLLAAPDAGVSTLAANLVSLARAWEQVRLFHPWLYEKDVKWDDAWVKFAPRAEAAATPEALQAVVADMLATLGDPVTHVRSSGPPGEARPGPMLELKNGVPIVNVWSVEFGNVTGSPDSMKALSDALKGQSRVVLDLRGTADLWVTPDDLLRLLPDFGPSKDAPVPSLRSVVHHGYAAAPGGYGGYGTAFEQAVPTVITKRASSPRRYAFVIDPDDRLSSLPLAMQRAGEGFIVATAPTDERVAVGSTDVELGHQLKASVRSSALLPPRGFAVDLVVPAGKSAIDAAVALVSGKQQVKQAPLITAGEPHGVVDAAYADAPYPSRELRQLAALRVWMIARRFWAYPALTTEDYDAVLGAFLPRLADARDESEYLLTLAEMSTHLHDGHTGLFSK